MNPDFPLIVQAADAWARPSDHDGRLAQRDMIRISLVPPSEAGAPDVRIAPANPAPEYLQFCRRGGGSPRRSGSSSATKPCSVFDTEVSDAGELHEIAAELKEEE